MAIYGHVTGGMFKPVATHCNIQKLYTCNAWTYP